MISPRPLTGEKFHLLGKGLNFCPKPKPYDAIKLAEETFTFSRRVQLTEFFAPDPEYEDSNYSDTEEDKPKVKREQSSFIPSAG